MSRTKRLKFDEIGYWSEIKLDIVKDYASAYSRILAAQTKPALHHVYVDAFAGARVHISKVTGNYYSRQSYQCASAAPPCRPTARENYRGGAGFSKRSRSPSYSLTGTGKVRRSSATSGYFAANASTLPISTSTGSTPGHSVLAPRNQR